MCACTEPVRTGIGAVRVEYGRPKWPMTMLNQRRTEECFFVFFLAPYARTTRYEEAFLPKGKKRPRSLRALGLAIFRFFPDFVLFDGFILLWSSLFTRKKTNA